jgi:Flagellar biosynthesis pathway, component FliR
MDSVLEWLGIAAPTFLLVFGRCVGMTFQAPVIGSRTVPGMIRVGLSFALAMVYFTTMSHAPALPSTFLGYLLLLVSEVLWGMTLGFVASIVHYAIQSAGDYVAQAVGLTMMSTMNPMLRTNTTATGQLFYYLGLAVFVLAGGHLFLLGAFFQSFELVPLGAFTMTTALWGQILNVTGALLLICVQIAMPAVVVMFLVDFALGVINRSAPSVQNILDMVQAVKPGVGLFIVSLMIPNVVSAAHDLSDRMIRDVHGAIAAEVRQPVAPPSPGSR